VFFGPSTSIPYSIYSVQVSSKPSKHVASRFEQIGHNATFLNTWLFDSIERINLLSFEPFYMVMAWLVWWAAAPPPPVGPRGRWARSNHHTTAHIWCSVPCPGAAPAALFAPADFFEALPRESEFQPGVATTAGAPLRSARCAAHRICALSGMAPCTCTRRCGRPHPHPGLRPRARGPTGPYSSKTRDGG